MVEKIKSDWNNFKTGILIAAFLWIAATLLGKGVCIYKRILGIACPGCGLSRSFLFILQGQFEEAWKLQPFAYGWIVFGILFLIDRYLFGKKEILWKVTLIILCAGMLLFYLYRLFTGGLEGI